MLLRAELTAKEEESEGKAEAVCPDKGHVGAARERCRCCGRGRASGE